MDGCLLGGEVQELARKFGRSCKDVRLCVLLGRPASEDSPFSFVLQCAGPCVVEGGEDRASRQHAPSSVPPRLRSRVGRAQQGWVPETDFPVRGGGGAQTSGMPEAAGVSQSPKINSKPPRIKNGAQLEGDRLHAVSFDAHSSSGDRASHA